jgi:hypothetical protein
MIFPVFNEHNESTLTQSFYQGDVTRDSGIGLITSTSSLTGSE